MPPLPTEFKPIYDNFTKGKITFDEMVVLGAKVGVKIETYNPMTERNPAYPTGNNDSRAGFTNDIHMSKSGKTFQGKLKPAMIRCMHITHAFVKYLDNKSINSSKYIKPLFTKIAWSLFKYPYGKVVNKMNAWALKKYDKDSFVYDDPRMQILSNNLHGYIDEFFDHEDRKLEFMHKTADICLFMLKEDIYYRARAFDMMNGLPAFVLTEQERENIETFTRGINVVDQFTLKPVNDPKMNPGILNEVST